MNRTRPLRAIQQLHVGTVCNTEPQAQEALRLAVAAGFEGIELNGFMVRPTPLLVRGLTRLAGMPAGRGGRLDWARLVGEAGLAVVALHEDLGRIERDPDTVVNDAARFGTDKVVITGLYRFDYTDPLAIADLAGRLNRAGERLAQAGVRLAYHNHNVELRRLPDGDTALEILLRLTDPALLGFEFDAYWPTVAGADPVTLMRRLGERCELLHLTDRGTRARGSSLTPIDKIDTVELGDGHIDLAALVEQAKAGGVHAVILETHRNWVDRSPIASFQRSAAFLRTHLPDTEEVHP